MARVLLTNFHSRTGTGHTTYIRTLTRVSEISSHVMGVAAPETSRLYTFLQAGSYPYLYRCDFPGRVLKNPRRFLESVLRFRQIVADFKPDIVHTSGGSDLFITLWSHPVRRTYKVVRTHHALIRPLRRDPYHLVVYRHLTDANVFVSKSSMELILSNGIRPRNPVVIPNGVDVERFRPVPKDRDLAEKYGIDEDTFCFGSNAGTKFYKRVDTIIHAAAMLRSERKYKILVLGPHVRELRELAGRLGVGQFVICGLHDDVVPYISLFDVGFVLSDRIETISFAAREMMSMGKPLISSTFSGLKENVQDGVNGILVEPGNVQEIAGAMKRFLDMDGGTLRSYSENARRYALENFDVKKQLEAHASLYAGLMGGA